MAMIHAEDDQAAERIKAAYWHGPGNCLESWEMAANVTLLTTDQDIPAKENAPFVYESPNAAYLAVFRTAYNLDGVLAGAADEYQAMLRLARWVGTRWDHGQDPVPGGSAAFAVGDTVRAGENGARFWCEIAAKALVQAAAAMGWPARLLAVSSDGYTYEHAVAELWSNQFGKWIMLDADFNMVLEVRGVPVSAYEICHRGPEWLRSDTIQLRLFGPSKPSLPLPRPEYYIGLFGYIHIDLRNDWHSRRLARGSPAGGDWATWWTAREDLGAVLTAKIRIDDEKMINGPVNVTAVCLKEVRQVGERYAFKVELSGYSPYFEKFMIQIDNGGWKILEKFDHDFYTDGGAHAVRTRMKTAGGHFGPVSELLFTLR